MVPVRSIIWTALGFSIFPLILGGVVWVPSPNHTIFVTIDAYLIYVVYLANAFSFGLGIAFLIYGWPLIRRVAVMPKWKCVGMHLAIAWLLISWWPRNYNRAIISSTLAMGNLTGISRYLFIDYCFQILLIAAAAYVALCFLEMLYKVVLGE